MDVVSSQRFGPWKVGLGVHHRHLWVEEIADGGAALGTLWPPSLWAEPYDTQ